MTMDLNPSLNGGTVREREERARERERQSERVRKRVKESYSQVIIYHFYYIIYSLWFA